MTRRTPTSTLILETLATRSGTTLLAREIATHLSKTYRRPTSPKSVSKQIYPLTDDYPLLNRRQTTNQEKAAYNCRYIYGWTIFPEETGE